MIIKADTGKRFRRIHDGFLMGNEIALGYDFSTGSKRQDLPEYYEQVGDDTELTDTEALNIILDRNEQMESL